MMKKHRDDKGFTLIELLIAVALIGILATISIIQHDSYRMRGFNAAASSDLKNLKAAMEAYFSEHQSYP